MSGKEKNKDSRMRSGIIFILVSPSGGGKTTICRKLLETDPKLRFSVSYTSRPPRINERGGVDYHFVDAETFKQKIERGDFLEWAIVHGDYYGTDRTKTVEETATGCDLLLDIDIQGADQIKKSVPDCVRIFIVPPSKEIMLERLRARGTDGPEALQRRLADAALEMTRWKEYDYVVLNDRLDEAVERVRAIITAERLSLHHGMPDMDNVLKSFGVSV
jgi:guanylate kinase